VVNQRVLKVFVYVERWEMREIRIAKLVCKVRVNKRRMNVRPNESCLIVLKRCLEYVNIVGNNKCGRHERKCPSHPFDRIQKSTNQKGQKCGSYFLLFFGLV
jgi:hypothetical protein